MFSGFILPLGQALIWSSPRVQGGAVVKAPAPRCTRWSQVTHYFFEGCRYYAPMIIDWPDGALAWHQPMNIARKASLA